MVKIWLLVLLFGATLARGDDTPEDGAAEPVLEVEEVELSPEDTIGGWEPLLPDEPEEHEQPEESDQADQAGEEPINWVDTSHGYLTDRTQDLAGWMDGFFGNPEWDLEQAESFLRLELIDDWENEDGHDFKLRLRGKVQLPRISRRLNLVFSGEDSDLNNSTDREVDDQVGLQYEVREGRRGRFDLTMSVGSGHLKPGIKYRNEGPLGESNSYRFVERVIYEDGEGFYSVSNLDLNHAADDNNIWRWNNRVIYGERSEGVEWRTRLSLFQRHDVETKRPIGVNYYATVSGVTRPNDFVKNYRLGFVFRRQVYRDFLFMELEPSYNYRRELYEEDRRSVWGMVVRLEIALHRDLRRVRREDRDSQTP